MHSVLHSSSLFVSLSSSGTKNYSKATTTHPSVKVEEVAKRSPPLFWSIFWNFQADVHRGLGAVLGMAESLMATGEEGEG